MDGKPMGNGEIGTKKVDESEIQRDKMRNGYEDFVFVATDFETLKENLQEVDNPNGDAGSNPPKKTSGYLVYGSSLIMRFKDKIKDIIEGVTLRIKGDKDKTKAGDKKKSESEAIKEDENQK